MDDLQLAVYQLIMFSLENNGIKQNFQTLYDLLEHVADAFPKKSCRPAYKKLFNNLHNDELTGMRIKSSIFKYVVDPGEIMSRMMMVNICGKT